LQRLFGITQEQALLSGRPPFAVHSGVHSVGLGFSATALLTDRWMLSIDGGINRVRGSAAESPITEARIQRALTISLEYCW
jgi:outer membrane scaffolding protein for murein synthesis (MipA/OmpV family)